MACCRSCAVCAFALACALNMEKLMTTRGKSNKEKENCKLENNMKGGNTLLWNKTENVGVKFGKEIKEQNMNNTREFVVV